MHDLWELDKSYNKDKKMNTIEDEKKVELDLVYDLEKLHKLILTITSSIEGPLGETFYN